MDSIQEAKKEETGTFKNSPDFFQSFFNLLSLYASSRWEQAGLSIRETGFQFLFYWIGFFSLSTFFIVGFFLFFYGLTQGISALTLIPEWIIYLIHGALLITIPFFILAFFKLKQKKKFLRVKLEEFKTEIMNEKVENPSRLIDQANKKKFEDERDFLSWKQNIFRENLAKSYKQLKNRLDSFIDIRQWVVRFPWEITGITLLVGFSLAINFSSPSNTPKMTHPHLPNHSSNMENSFSYFTRLGGEILKEVVPPLVVNHFVDKSS